MGHSLFACGVRLWAAAAAPPHTNPSQTALGNYCPPTHTPNASPGHDPTYIAYKGFNSGLLHDWAVRTENPWEANLFYVPALTYAYSSNLGDVVEHLRRVMAWVRTAHPFFNRTGGRDHFAWLPNDRCVSVCDVVACGVRVCVCWRLARQPVSPSTAAHLFTPPTQKHQQGRVLD